MIPRALKQHLTKKLNALAFSLFSIVMLVLLSVSCATPKENSKPIKLAQADSNTIKEAQSTSSYKSTRKTDIEKPDWGDIEEGPELAEKVEEGKTAIPEELEAIAKANDTQLPEKIPEEKIKETIEEKVPVKAEPPAKKDPFAALDENNDQWQDDFIKDMEGIKKSKASRDTISKGNLVQLFPVADEIEIGEGVAARILNNTDEYKDEALWEYVSFVGISVAEISSRNDIQYYFIILDDDEINAFAAPGGYIFITKGAIAFCENEAELASILAHEIAHVGHRHGIRALDMSKYRVMSKMMLNEMDKAFENSAVFKQSQEDLEYKQLAKELTEIADICFKQTQNPYNQEMECDADEEGVVIMAKAGYNPFAALVLMERLKKKVGVEPAFEKALRSHPTASARVEIIRRTIEDAGLQNTGAVNEKRFLRHVQNLK